MHRRPESLAEKEFDLVIVGGGIYGACAAWEAVTRGLSVALLEQKDFGWSTSANMHRILHGGFRYLRNADFKRIRESVRERNTMMRLAPHLTGPLPFLVPTEKTGIQNKEVMRLAIKLYDALSFGRNTGIEPARRIPNGRIISQSDCLKLAPGLSPNGVTGGAVWYDGHISDPARLCLEFVRSAFARGAAAVNYIEATGFLNDGPRITGVSARDVLTDEKFEVRGKLVLNCTGPWSARTLQRLSRADGYRPPRYIRSIDVVTRPLTLANHGLALMAPQDGEPDQIIRYFIAPWRGLSVIGSVDYMHDIDPDAFDVQEREVEYMIDVIRKTMPGANLTVDDVLAVQAGLIPHDDTKPLEDPYNAARHYKIVDHSKSDGLDGLFSVMGIKYTTARDIAQKTIDRILKRLGRTWAPSVSATTPLYGGPIDDFGAFVQQSVDDSPLYADKEQVESLVRTYGPVYGEVLGLLEDEPELRRPVAPGSPVYAVQVAYAIRREMAQKLTDVVVRRTNLGLERHPGRVVLERTAALMAGMMGWDTARRDSEMAETEAYLKRFWVRPDVSGASP